MGVAPVKVIFAVIVAFEVAKKGKQASITKFVILPSIGIIVIKSMCRKQGQSSALADILVDILIPVIQLMGSEVNF